MFLNELVKHWSFRLFAPDQMVQKTYEAFRELLGFDIQAHDLMAEFEELYYSGKREDFCRINRRYEQLAAAVLGMVHCLEKMSPTQSATLGQYHRKFDFYARFLLAPPQENSGEPFVLKQADISKPDLVGNKSYNLARLQAMGYCVPPGFTITTNSFSLFVEHNNLRPAIDTLLTELDLQFPDSLARVSRELVDLVIHADIPQVVAQSIFDHSDHLQEQEGEPLFLAVRSSALFEDGEHSFAGLYKTELGVSRETLLQAYRKVIASKYSQEALLYRINLGYSDQETPIAALVVPMIEARASGVLYTKHPGPEGLAGLLIQSVAGLCEPLVSGEVVPDSYYYNREPLGFGVFEKGRQKSQLVLVNGRPETLPLGLEQLKQPSLSREKADLLAEAGLLFEDTLQGPQDVEWVQESSGRIIFLQARPLPVKKESGADFPEKPSPSESQIVLRGLEKGAGGRASGTVYIAAPGTVDTVPAGSILVVEHTPPSLVRLLDRVSAVVAEQGSVAGHFATVCREFRIPLLVSCHDARQILARYELLTVDGDSGTILLGPVSSEELEEQDKRSRDVPYFKKLKAVLGFITPLQLINPKDRNFSPQSCRSLHDIIRYSHEKGVQCMFDIGDALSGRSRRSRKLASNLPLEMYLLNVGNGFCEDDPGDDPLPLGQVCSKPFISLWKGLGHSGIDWESHDHFDWKTYDEVALAGGIASKSSADLASYAIVSTEYLNLNMRFGYHFVLVDAMAGADSRANYCQLRFAGGGGDYMGRSFRLDFLSQVLQQHDFEISVKADLLDARRADLPAAKLLPELEMLGRLLGATKLMDMVLKDGKDVERCVDAFLTGTYTFTKKNH